MKAHGKAFKKAEMGTKMVNTQLHQLTDFGNPPIAQNGMAFNDLLANAQATNTGVSRGQYDEQQKEAARQKAAIPTTATNMGSGVGNLLSSFSSQAKTAATNSALQDAGSEIGAAAFGKNGKKLKKAQAGFDLTSFGTALGTATQKQGGVGSELANIFGGAGSADKIMGGAGKSFAGSAGAAGLGVLNAAPQILQGIGQMKQQKQNILGAEQTADISALTAQAAGGRAQKQQDIYVRPENKLVQPGQLGSPKGTDTNYLAQYGTRISGNPTEIQNTYAPNNLYNDLGYEPLNESSPKQYRTGGELPKADVGFSDFFQSSGQGSIGKGIGSAVGSAFFGPIGGAVGGFLGNAAGNLLGGDDDARKLANYQNQTTQNTQRAAWAAGTKNLQAQNAGFMKEGGWVSNDWQPQTITKFGEYSLKDLLQPPHDADMLRSGGHLKEDYVAPSARALSTERPLMPIAEDGTQMAMGGDLEVGRGKIETLSHNPYLGELNIFRGPSHANGGMPTRFGNNQIEVEGGEPVVKIPSSGDSYTKFEDGGNTDGDAVVYGNMQIPKWALAEIGDKLAEGRKFKHYATDIAKNDKKQNQIIDRATSIVNNSGENTPFDQLALNSGKAMLIGATAKHLVNAKKLEDLASVQNFILDKADEFGYKDPDKFNKDVMKGKLTQAKFGAKLNKAQDGKELANKKYQDSANDVIHQGYLQRMKAYRDHWGYDNYNEPLMHNLGLPTDATKDYVNVPVNTAVPNNAPAPLPSQSTHLTNEASGHTPYSNISQQQTSVTPTVSPANISGGKEKVKGKGKQKNNTQVDRNAFLNSSGPISGTDPYAWTLNTNTDIPLRTELVQDEYGNYYDPYNNVVDQSGALPGKFSTTTSDGKKKGDRNTAITDAISSAFNYARPTNQMPLDPNQLMGEMYALGNNQVEPVQAQTYQPMLQGQPSRISLQDQLNSIDAQSNAAIRAAGRNPGAQAQIMASAAEMKNKVLGEQFRMNQGAADQTYGKNRELLNQAQSQNLGILDKQYEKQSIAKSNTKRIAQEALGSIASKIAQQKLENRKLGIYENLYKYRFNPITGEAINENGLASFTKSELASGATDVGQVSGKSSTLSDYEKAKATVAAFEKKVKEDTKPARNGAIVKALKTI